jgi:catechol-2,3-dioxygenase
MRGVMVFVVGLMVGAAMQVSLAQNQSQSQVVMMNHVGIRVPNIEEAVKYYTESYKP